MRLIGRRTRNFERRDEEIMVKTEEKKGELPGNIDKNHVNKEFLKGSDERSESVESQENKEEIGRNIKDRMEQLIRLRKRMRLSAEANRKDLFSEYQRLKEDPKLARKIELKRQDAEKKLDKQESIERGEDYERKRAWDWTIEESERWDQRMKEKQEARDKSLFADYTQAAQHSYEKLMRKFKPDLEGYEKERAKVMANKEMLNENDMEVGNTYESFYRDANFLGFANNKPSKKAIDRLIEDLNKQEEMRNKSRKRIDPDDEDVSYINERNANFNRKISRFYDKYTREIRESLERGTAV